MKKFLRILVVFLGLGVLVMFCLALYEPQDIVVTRSILIRAPKEAVFEQMVRFKNWTNWSPWYLMDTGMRLTYSGTDGQPGSGYEWRGEDNKTGAGDMRNTGVQGTSMNFDVHFTAPRDGKAKGLLSAKDSAGMTKASWTFIMHVGFPFNGMTAFMNMDKMLGGDFEVGLANIKKYTESHIPATPGVDIKEVDYAAQLYEGIRQTVSIPTISQFFSPNLINLYKQLNDKITGPGTGLFYTWDTVKNNSDMAVVFPVKDSTRRLPGGSFMYVAASRALLSVYKGGYANEAQTHAAMVNEAAAKGKKTTLTIEEYIAGPMNEPDSNKWITNIYYLVQ